jgi:hypothetical protein
VNRALPRWLLAFTFLIAGTLTSPVVAAAQSVAFCANAESPHFAFGLADLKAAIGDTMGDPLECEHSDSANGDTLQQTTTGLAIYHQDTNTPEFTDGFNHWALGNDGLQAWSDGDAQATAPGPEGGDQATAPGPWDAPPADAQDAAAPSRGPATPTGPPSPGPAAPAANPPPPLAATQCVDVGGGECLHAVPELADTVALLAKTSSATPLLRAASKAGYIIHYGDLPVDVLGLFRPSRHDVVLSNLLKPFPTLDRAPVLAHELQHIFDWLSHPAAMETAPGCLATETNAFATESSIWLELAGDHLKSPSNDLEREFNMISQEVTNDPAGFADRLTLAYHDQCTAS